MRALLSVAQGLGPGAHATGVKVRKLCPPINITSNINALTQQYCDGESSFLSTVLRPGSERVVAHSRLWNEAPSGNHTERDISETETRLNVKLVLT